MTAPDRVGRLLNDIDTFIQTEVDAAVKAATDPLNTELEQARQSVADAQAQHGVDTAEITKLKARVAELEAAANPPPAPAKVIYGANLGGWADLQNAAANAAQIRKAWPGLKAVRVWTSDASVPAPYADPAAKVYVCELGYTTDRATVEAAVKRALPNTVLTPAHEPSNPDKKITPEMFKTFTALVGDVVLKSGRKDLVVVPVLMGGAFHPKRAASVGGPWTDWIANPLPPGVTAIGGDLYPFDVDKGKPENILQPALDAAEKLNVPFYVGEYGNGKKSWTDAERADWVRKSVAFFNAHADRFPIVLAYESSRGSGGPHNILPKPDGSGGSPQAVEEYRKAVASS